MKKYLFLVLCCVFGLCKQAYAQKNILNDLLDQGDLMIKERRYADAVGFYTDCLEKYPKKYWAEFYFNIGNAHYNLGNPEEALTAYENCMLVAREEKQFVPLAAAQNNIGDIYYDEGNYEQAITQYNKSSKLFGATGNKLEKGVALYHLGLCYKELAVYDRSTELIYESVATFDSLKEEYYLAKAYQSLGNIFRIQEDYEHSLEFHFKALKLKKSIGDQRELSASLNDIGNTYKELQNYEEAIRYYEQAGNIEDEEFQATILNNLGEVYFELGEVDKAEGFYRESLALHERLGDQKGVALTLTELGELYFEKKSYLEAERFLKRAEPICEEMKYKDVLLQNRKIQWQLYEDTKRYKEASTLAMLCLSLEKEIFNEAKSKVINGLNISYGVENTQKEMALMSKDLQLKENRLRQEQYVKIGLLAFVLLVVLFAVFSMRNKQRLIKVEKARASLEQSLRIDTQHRTKNFLQVIMSISQFMKRQMDATANAHLVEDFQKKIDTMILVNNSLQVESGAEVMRTNFNVFLEELVQNLLVSIKEPEQYIQTVLELSPLQLDAKKAYPLALIANELITNALKYGLKGKEACLTVRLNLTGDQFEMEVGDNGAGLPESFDRNTLNSYGFRLIEIFTAQIKGVMQVENDGGLIVRIKAGIE